MREPQRQQTLSGIRSGVLLALAASAVWLLAQGGLAIFSPVSCEGLSAQECQLETEIVHGFGKRQLLAGGALTLMALGLRKLWKRS